MKNRLVMYLDIDAFFPSVEQVRFPNLSGRPVVVGSGVVASSSYEARRRGIRTGMPIAQAVRICPQTIVLKGHQHVYAAFAERVFDHCRELSPAVETYLDEAFCDLTGTPAATRDPIALAQDFKAAIARETGLGITVGFASNRMIAKLAAKDVKPDGVAAVTAGSEEAFMEARGVGDVAGIGWKAAEMLRQINVTRVCELKQFPLRYLRSLFGKNAWLIYERLRGRDPYEAPAFPRSISRETSFTRETIDCDEILGTLYYLAGRACRSARALKALPARVTVKLRYGDGTHETASARYSQARVEDREVFALAKDIFTVMYRRCRLRLVGVVLAGLTRVDAAQDTLYEASLEEKLAGLYLSLDAIRAKYGHSAVIVGRSVDLMNRLERDSYGYVLRTPSLTK
jgi:DNA polymerase IV